MSQTPSVGRIVHYVSYGTPKGEFTSQCRAAIITDIHDDVVTLCVFSPQGVFFNEAKHDSVQTGGTWHWPEQVGPQRPVQT